MRTIWSDYRYNMSCSCPLVAVAFWETKHFVQTQAHSGYNIMKCIFRKFSLYSSWTECTGFCSVLFFKSTFSHWCYYNYQFNFWVGKKSLAQAFKNPYMCLRGGGWKKKRIARNLFPLLGSRFNFPSQ